MCGFPPKPPAAECLRSQRPGTVTLGPRSAESPAARRRPTPGPAAAPAPRPALLRSRRRARHLPGPDRGRRPFASTQPDGRRGPSASCTGEGGFRHSAGTASYETPSTGRTWSGARTQDRYSAGSTESPGPLRYAGRPTSNLQPSRVWRRDQADDDLLVPGQQHPDGNPAPARKRRTSSCPHRTDGHRDTDERYDLRRHRPSPTGAPWPTGRHER